MSGSILAAYVVLQFHIVPVLLPLWISILIILPAFIDGILQYAAGIMSTNRRRIITGIIAGYGITNVILHIPIPF